MRESNVRFHGKGVKGQGGAGEGGHGVNVDRKKRQQRADGGTKGEAGGRLLGPKQKRVVLEQSCPPLSSPVLPCPSLEVLSSTR